MKILIGQKIIDKLRGKNKSQNKFPFELPKTTVNFDKQIVAVGGFGFSGSGAVVDLLSEYKNCYAYGCSEVYSKSKRDVAEQIEMKFLIDEGNIFNLTWAFNLKDEVIQDFVIKQFIYLTYRYFDENKNSIIFRDKFLKDTQDFLFKILELDEKTIDIMKDKRFPYEGETLIKEFSDCCFVYNKNNYMFLYYKFKQMSINKLNLYICDYLYNFFGHWNTKKDIIVCDQLLSSGMMLNTLNFYMNEYPVKEICVYRDPRDQFMSTFRAGIHSWLPRSLGDYVNFYKNATITKISQISPHRLCIKFEDLVLKYDETVKKIEDFLGLKPEDHIAPKSVFDPEISKVNIGAWKEFIDQDFMKKIAEALPEYCYNEKD